MTTGTKLIYLMISGIYFILIMLWFGKSFISYKIAGIKPELIEERSLTQQEYKALSNVPKIEAKLTNVFVIISFVVFVISLIFLKMHWFQPILFIKTITVISLVFALALLLIKSISFIPGPPIR
ncbi:MAG: hypothetical protein ABUT20_65740 [Bacteroidota bacterium]